MNTNDKANEILIVSSSERGAELQNAIQECLGTPVTIAVTYRAATTAIARSHFKAVILDESLADLEPTNADSFLEHCIDELPIFVKLAITGVSRCVQQVRLALRRFDREQANVTVSAQRIINSQLRDALTSILIHSQLALKTPDLPPDAIKHIKSVLEASIVLQQVIGSKVD